MSDKPTGLLAWKIARKLPAAYQAFSFKLFRQVVERNPHANIFVSPFSVAVLLQMLYTGAAGKTRQALSELLELREVDDETLARGNAEFRRTLSEAWPAVELLLANSLWVRTGLEFKADFLERAKECFAAEIRSLDFADPGAPETINRWAAQNTKGKISEIVGPLHPLLVMILLNALYFKAQWRDKFDPARTKEKTFHRADASETKVPMMVEEGEYEYYENTDFQIVGLPYARGGFTLYVFVPRSKSLSLRPILLGELFQSRTDLCFSYPQRKGEVQIPRFKFAYESELEDVLTAMGAGEIFRKEEADLSGICEQRDMFVGQVWQKAVVEVNEEGTEAVAVTGLLELAAGLDQPPRPFKLVADRPFFFVIQAERLVLFMGAVNDPS